MKFWKEKELKEKVKKACYLLRESCDDWIKDRQEAIKRGETVPDDILTLMIHALGMIKQHWKLNILEYLYWVHIFLLGFDASIKCQGMYKGCLV